MNPEQQQHTNIESALAAIRAAFEDSTPEVRAELDSRIALFVENMAPIWEYDGPSDQIPEIGFHFLTVIESPEEGR